MKPVYTLLTVTCILFSDLALAAYDSASLKTLFTDKSQRAQIDAERSGIVVQGKPSPQSNKVKVNGYITRSDGRSVVWVNNKSTLKSSTVGNVKVQQTNIGKNKKVGVTVDGKHNHLKPGETWDKESGKTIDAY